MGDVSTNDPVDCQVSKWSDWSPCTVSCGSGYRHRYRQILVHIVKNTANFDGNFIFSILGLSTKWR